MKYFEIKNDRLNSGLTSYLANPKSGGKAMNIETTQAAVADIVDRATVTKSVYIMGHTMAMYLEKERQL